MHRVWGRVTTSYIEKSDESVRSESLLLRRTITLVPGSSMNKLTEVQLYELLSNGELKPWIRPQLVAVRGGHPE